VRGEGGLVFLASDLALLSLGAAGQVVGRQDFSPDMWPLFGDVGACIVLRRSMSYRGLLSAVPPIWRRGSDEEV
jgi:hypothetical protein